MKDNLKLVVCVIPLALTVSCKKLVPSVTNASGPEVPAGEVWLKPQQVIDSKIVRV